jgi:phosphocarrier protein
VTRQEVVILNAMGLHARAAARFVQLASRFQSRIEVLRDNRSANGKSILGLLSLVGRQGTRLTIAADGPDEAEAVQALVRLIDARFGEREHRG